METQSLKNNNIELNQILCTNDNLLNDFLNKNISLESLIEKEIYNNPAGTK